MTHNHAHIGFKARHVSLCNKHGFTLIELLVVIAIISLLVSILIPSLQKAKDLAKEAVCLSNLRNIGLAIHQYLIDYDGTIVPSATSGSGELYQAQPLWYDRLAWNQYLDYSQGLMANGTFVSAPTQTHVLHCSADERDVGFCSYSVNRFMAGLVIPPDNPPFNVDFRVHKIEEFNRLDRIILAGDRGNIYMPMGGGWSPVGTGAGGFSGWNIYCAGYDWTRHSRETKVYDDEIVDARGGIVHVDGHVEIYSGNIQVDPSYPGAGVRYASPDSPFPLLTDYR